MSSLVASGSIGITAPNRLTNNILHRVLDRVDEYRDAPFLIDAGSGSMLTYGACDTIARGLAAELQRRGVRRASRVALLLKNSPEFALLYFGCLYLGAVVVPVDPGLHRRDVDAILQRSGAMLVIGSSATDAPFDLAARERVGAAFWNVVPSSQRDTRTRDDGWSLGEPLAEPPADWSPFEGVTPNDLFAINFTSGTTSVPKGVAHRIGGLLNNAVAFNEAMSFGPDSRFLHVFPMAYMAGFLNTLLSPFMAGASVVLAGRFGAQHALKFWDPVRRYGVNTLWLAPTMLATLLHLDRDPSAPDYCRTRLRHVCVGTAPLPLAIKDAFERKYGTELLESYGLSELLFVSTNSRHAPRHDGSVGRPLPGVEIQIGNEHGENAALGADGDVRIKSAYCMVGYLDSDTSQPDALRDDWFPTGDIGHLSADGDLYITGRAKDLIIRGGVNVSPRAIEDALLEHAAVAEAAVIGLPHEFYGEEIVAVLKLKAGHALPIIALSLEAFCKERLAVASRPDRFVEVTAFPVSISGKIQKAKLRQHLVEDSTQSTP